MDLWKDVIVSPEMSLGEAIRRIDISAMQIALVVDAMRRLVGVVTDGDIRRAFLEGHDIDFPISRVMNQQPYTLPGGTTHEDALNYMRQHSIHHVPLVESDGTLCGVYFIDELIGSVKRPNAVVLMAGGLGTRLRPLTETCPKPLLPVGGKPILERIIERFVEQGFQNFYISVNYMAEMIMAHFGNGERWGVRIKYLRETEKLGTAGALSLLPEKPTHAFVVMNGDLLTEVNFVSLLREHEARNVLATMAVREYEMQIPYGVVNVESGYIKSIKEKPLHKFLINAGIYILEPAVLRHIPLGHIDMPVLFGNLKDQGRTWAYPLREYWIDIGRLEDMEAAQFAFQVQV